MSFDTRPPYPSPTHTHRVRRNLIVGWLSDPLGSVALRGEGPGGLGAAGLQRKLQEAVAEME